MSNEYYKKDEQKLLIAILDKYIEDNGDQLVALDVYQFSSLDPSLFKTVPRITKEKVHDRQNSDSRYFGNLKDKEFISGKESMGSVSLILKSYGIAIMYLAYHGAQP